MTYVPPHLAIVKHLLSQPTPTLAQLADEFAPYGRLIVRDALPIAVQGSGLRAVVVMISSPGSNYPTHDIGSNVTCRLYADHTRSAPKQPATKEDGIDRAWAMFGPLDQLLHSPGRSLTTGAQELQCDRLSQPLESFDQEQEVPYLAVIYEVALHIEA